MASKKPKEPIPVYSPEVAAFNGYLDALKSIFFGINYVTHFEVKSFDLPSHFVSVSKVMLMAYPCIEPEAAYIKEHSLEVFFEKTNACFVYPDAYLTEVDPSGNIAGSLRIGFWRHLKNCIEYEDSTIYSYYSKVGLPGFDVFWQFSWLIHNAAQKRCVFLYGGSSD